MAVTVKTEITLTDREQQFLEALALGKRPAPAAVEVGYSIATGGGI